MTMTETRYEISTSELADRLGWGRNIYRTVHYLAEHGFLPKGEGSGSRRRHSLNDALVIAACWDQNPDPTLGGPTRLGLDLREDILRACMTAEPYTTIQITEGPFTVTYRPPWELLLQGTEMP